MYEYRLLFPAKGVCETRYKAHLAPIQSMLPYRLVYGLIWPLVLPHTKRSTIWGLEFIRLHMLELVLDFGRGVIRSIKTPFLSVKRWI